MIKKILAFLLVIVSAVTLASDNFILNSIDEAKTLSVATNKPILLIFGADYCGFCNSLKNDILEFELSPGTDEYIICYIDISENPSIQKEYKVTTIPDSRIIKNNIEKFRNRGYIRKKYIQWIENAKNH